MGGVGCKGVSPEHLSILAEKLVHATKAGLETAVVVGGGNLLRGANLSGSTLIRPFAAHQMGMIATGINGLALSETLQSMGQKVKLLSAFNIGSFVEAYSVEKARAHLAAGEVVILAGGTGSPYVTTDTCAAIRAAELGADAVFKATKVDGVYSDDPTKNPKAERFDRLTYDQVIDRRLKIIDLVAVRICQEAKIPILVFKYEDLDRIEKVLEGKVPSSIIRE